MKMHPPQSLTRIDKQKSAKIRIIETVHSLFYEQGIHTVGIDRIISEAQITKATLYKYFPSKETLIIAYIHKQSELVRQWFAERERSGLGSLEILKELVEYLSSEFDKSNFRGDAFANASLEYPDLNSEVRRAIREHEVWYNERIEKLFASAGHPSPNEAAMEFVTVLYGASVSAYWGHIGIMKQIFIGTHDRLLGQIPQKVND